MEKLYKPRRKDQVTELLKQDQYSPLQVEEQVCVIYAGTRGYLDGIDTKSVGKYEKDLLAHLHAEHSSILADIASEKKLTDDIEDRLKAALAKFTENFTA